MHPAPHDSQVFGFCPTGWLFEMKKRPYGVHSKGPLSVMLVPYRRVCRPLTAHVFDRA
jgi:hypothetical protein